MADHTDALMEVLDIAQTSPDQREFRTMCGRALTLLLRKAEDDGLDDVRPQARRFGKICMKTEKAKSAGSLRGFASAIPAGGNVFDGGFADDDDDDAEARRPAKKSLRGNKDGRGPNCVYDDAGKLVRCFAKMETAKQVARGFGAGFTAKKRRG